MATQVPAEPKTHRRLLMIAGLALAIVLAAGITVLVLHHRTGNPHTAGRLPHVSGSRQVNPTIERRADQFVDALRAL